MNLIVLGMLLCLKFEAQHKRDEEENEIFTETPAPPLIVFPHLKEHLLNSVFGLITV